MTKTELYLGLDVHKETITAAIAEAGRHGEVRQAGAITNDLHALEKLLSRVRGTPERTQHVCREAAPYSFVIFTNDRPGKQKATVKRCEHGWPALKDVRR